MPMSRRAIERYGHVAVVGEMPYLAPLTAEALAAWTPMLDSAEFLRKWLR